MFKVRIASGLLILLSSALLLSCSSAAESEAALEDQHIVETSGEVDTGNGHMDEDSHMDDDGHMDDDDHMEDAGHMAGDEHGEDEHVTGRMHMHAEVPHEYEDFVNPLAADPAAVQAGAETFTTYCIVCHGEEGRGDGTAAETLDPPPANLADSAMMGSLSDAYLYWRISEGGLGDPFNSAMPAWKETFSAEQTWQLVTYLRTLEQ